MRRPNGRGRNNRREPIAMTPAPENAAMSQILTLRSAIKELEIRHSHKNGSFENGSIQLACRYGQPSKLDCGGRGVRSLSRCRQSTSQPRYAFSRGCSLAQDGKGRARTRQGHKPRPHPFSVVATPSEGAGATRAGRQVRYHRSEVWRLLEVAASCRHAR